MLIFLPVLGASISSLNLNSRSTDWNALARHVLAYSDSVWWSWDPCFTFFLWWSWGFHHCI